MSLRITDKRKFIKAVLTILLVSFLGGLVLGTCALGVKVPGALFDLATGQ